MFSLNSLKPVSFSLQSFKMAEEASSGRSGYWKLFFYNMQEEALRKDEQKQGKSATQSAGSRASQESVAKPKRSRAHRVTPEAVEDFEPLPKPLYRKKKDDFPSEITCLVQQNWVKLLGLNVPLEFYYPPEPAANDDDEEEFLLLLVA